MRRFSCAAMVGCCSLPEPTRRTNMPDTAKISPHYEAHCSKVVRFVKAPDSVLVHGRVFGNERNQ